MRFKLLFIIFLVYMIRLVAEEKEEDNLQECFEQSQKRSTYVYPYSNLAETLQEEGQTVFPLFSYGSLMNEESARRTLSQKALETRTPALAFGLKRLFDRDVPIKPDSRWGIPCDPNARGMLNVHPSDLDDFVNGVLIQLPLEDLASLLDREVGYDLIPVIVTHWDAFQNGEEKYSIAYALSAPAQSKYVNSSILPRPGYYELTRQAAKDYGPQFEALWFETTYLADSISPITHWEMRLPRIIVDDDL